MTGPNRRLLRVNKIFFVFFRIYQKSTHLKKLTEKKGISRYTESLVNFTISDNPPEKLRSATNSAKSSIRDLNNSQLTTYQDAINKTNKEIRVKHLRSLMKFIPVIKTWSNVQKQNLMQILLENESKSSLQHLVECVVRK